MALLNRLLIIVTILLGCVGCDQATKVLAESYLPLNGVWSLGHDMLRIQLAHNPGAFLGLGGSLLDQLRLPFFAYGVGGGLLVLLGYTLFKPKLVFSELLGLALILAGGLSNCLDRLLTGGYVIDFMNIGLGSVRTGIFNFADVFIMLGSGLILATSFKSKRKVV